MKNEQTLKNMVKDRYSKIAEQGRAENAASCCGATDPSQEVYNIMSESYENEKGYVAEADLGLGCGLPVKLAKISKGDTVIDLGSGAGNDCFVARHETGPEGKVIGIDFSLNMIQKARKNAEKLGLNNVEFREGDIEFLPVSDDVAEVVISNCVLNLVPNKQKVIREIHRVLKPGGHFSISDIVLVGDLPAALQEDAEMYAGCVAGAIQKDKYMNFLQEAGFAEVVIQKEKPILIPDDILSKYLNPEEIDEFKKGDIGIFSLSVFGIKPGDLASDQSDVHLEMIACDPGGGCC